MTNEEKLLAMINEEQGRKVIVPSKAKSFFSPVGYIVENIDYMNLFRYVRIIAYIAISICLSYLMCYNATQYYLIGRIILGCIFTFGFYVCFCMLDSYTRHKIKRMI